LKLSAIDRLAAPVLYYTLYRLLILGMIQYSLMLNIYQWKYDKKAYYLPM